MSLLHAILPVGDLALLHPWRSVPSRFLPRQGMKHPGCCAVLLLLVLLTPVVHAQFRLSSSRADSGKQNSSSEIDSSSRDGAHHPQITVTGVEVGVAASPAPPPTPDAAPNLIGDLISAASGESNGTIAQVLDKALAKEFERESKNAESGKGKTFNETVAHEEVSRSRCCR